MTLREIGPTWLQLLSRQEPLWTADSLRGVELAATLDDVLRAPAGPPTPLVQYENLPLHRYRDFVDINQMLERIVPVYAEIESLAAAWCGPERRNAASDTWPELNRTS